MRHITIEKQKVVLRLPGFKPRFIGKLDGSTFKAAPRAGRLHKLNKLDSLGINKELLDRFSQIKVVSVPYNKTVYQTTSAYLKANGVVAHFGKYEEQIFLPLGEWDIV